MDKRFKQQIKKQQSQIEEPFAILKSTTHHPDLKLTKTITLGRANPQCKIENVKYDSRSTAASAYPGIQEKPPVFRRLFPFLKLLNFPTPLASS